MKADWELAVAGGDVEGVRLLLASGADVNALNRYGQTALMIAAHKGHAPVVHELVARGARLNHTAKFGLSALMLAVIADHPEVVRLLLDAGADTALKGSDRTAPFHDKTARELADSLGRVRCAEMFEAGHS
jgi:ankyrin repeat protein